MKLDGLGWDRMEGMGWDGMGDDMGYGIGWDGIGGGQCDETDC